MPLTITETRQWLVVLSLDMPDIVKPLPVVTCPPLLGDVIFTICSLFWFGELLEARTLLDV
jgi:hypothetical protein